MICSLPDIRAGIRVDENGALAAPTPTVNSGAQRGEWCPRAFAGARRRRSVSVRPSHRALPSGIEYKSDRIGGEE